MAGPNGGNLFQENTSGRGTYGELAQSQPLSSLLVFKRRGNHNFYIYHAFLIIILFIRSDNILLHKEDSN